MTGDKVLDMYVSDTSASATEVTDAYLLSARAGWWGGNVAEEVNQDGLLVVRFFSATTGLVRESCGLALASRGANQIRLATLVLESLDGGVTVAWTLHCETLRELEGDLAAPPLRGDEAVRAWRDTEPDRIRLRDGT